MSVLIKKDLKITIKKDNKTLNKNSFLSNIQLGNKQYPVA
jgi:hypothetical protein